MTTYVWAITQYGLIGEKLEENKDGRIFTFKETNLTNKFQQGMYISLNSFSYIWSILSMYLSSFSKSDK